ncbi:hypothetical protein GOP47_0006966 [Adiantum capillus-veneris]|uniref:Uncharacterized protein n=1 Tax=Adiantum capillus-veneris TaxID=13818 RepID=A0A9D4V187_ADICA|nr:hypothetical protein GOP47_0006966 [Adiantum capillus-veneris]
MQGGMVNECRSGTGSVIPRTSSAGIILRIRIIHRSSLFMDGAVTSIKKWLNR